MMEQQDGKNLMETEPLVWQPWEYSKDDVEKS